MSKKILILRSDGMRSSATTFSDELRFSDVDTKIMSAGAPDQLKECMAHVAEHGGRYSAVVLMGIAKSARNKIPDIKAVIPNVMVYDSFRDLPDTTPINWRRDGIIAIDMNDKTSYDVALKAIKDMLTPKPPGRVPSAV